MWATGPLSATAQSVSCPATCPISGCAHSPFGNAPQHPLASLARTGANGACHVQVGSKNAAFFMGGCTKVVTKSAQSSFVHELTLAAGELEERYRNQQVHTTIHAMHLYLGL